MQLSNLIEALQGELEKTGDHKVMVDVDAQFRDITHADTATFRDPEGDYPVTFLNLKGKD